MVARDPTLAVIDRLTELWQDAEHRRAACTATGRCAPSAGRSRPAPTSTPQAAAAAAASRSSARPTFEDLPVRFQVCAASIERAAEHWFDSGPLVDAVIASAAVPGLLPPAKVGDEHFLDGGIVNSIPLGRAVELGRRPGSSCSRSAGSTGRSSRRGDRGRWRGCPSRSPAGTGSPARCAELPDGVEAHVLPGPRHVGARRLAAGAPRLLRGSQRRIDATLRRPSRGLPRRRSWPVGDLACLRCCGGWWSRRRWSC